MIVGEDILRVEVKANSTVTIQKIGDFIYKKGIKNLTGILNNSRNYVFN